MNKNIKRLIVALGVIVPLLAYFIIKNQPTTALDDNTIKHENLSANKLTLAKDKPADNGSFLAPLKVVPATDLIIELNANLPRYFDYNDDNAKVHEVGNLSVKSRENSDDVVDKIEEYLSDVSKYQIQLASLQMNCSKNKQSLKRRQKAIEDSKPNLNEMYFNEYYFSLGIDKSGFCDKSGTKEDIFWVFLKLARAGDELAQLRLLDNLRFAVNQNVRRFNIQKYPLEYMQIRDEAIGYLAKLSARGLHRASDKLARLYKGGYSYWDIVEPNRLLAYYYSYLAVEQDGLEPVPYQVDLNVLYNRLTDRQKKIVDRMTESL